MMKAQTPTTITNARQLVEFLIARGEPERTIIDKMIAYKVPLFGSADEWAPGTLRTFRQAVRASMVSFEPEITKEIASGIARNAKPAEIQPYLLAAAELVVERKLDQLAARNVELSTISMVMPDFEDMREVYRAINNYRIARMLRYPVMNNGANLSPDAAEYLADMFNRCVSPLHITEAMNRHGHRTHDGRRWSQSTLFLETMRRGLHHLESCQLDIDVAELIA